MTSFPCPEYGSQLLSKLPRDFFEAAVLVCAREAWELVRQEFSAPLAVCVPASMEHSALMEQLAALPKARTVFGIGGGSACDAAKLLALNQGVRLVLMPSALSVDAAFCRAVALRENSRVRYVGDIKPERLLVDFDLIKKAPAFLNRAGVCDVFSIHTALWDWRLAHDVKGERLDEALFLQSAALLKRLHAGADHIRACDEEGLILLGEAYTEEVRLCEAFGSSRPEEGSEHYFAYCLEFVTKRSYIHGELVCFGILLACLVQDRPIDDVFLQIQHFGVDCSPARLGLTRELLHKTLLALPGYLKEESQLPYGIFHHRPMTNELAHELTDAIFALFV